MARIQDYLHKLVGVGGSDLLLASERPPLYRSANELLPLPGEGLLTHAELRAGLEAVLDPDAWQLLQEEQHASFALHLEDGLRAQGSCHVSRHGLTVRVRLLGVMDLSQVDLSLPPGLRELVSAEAGLIVVTGPAGSGKTTWIAAFLTAIAAQRPLHIATCDDPVEYILPAGHGAISQRSLGRHCRSLAEAIDAALDTQAQVIACSELQAPGVFERLVEAAGSGVLAIGELRGAGSVAALEQLMAAAPSASRPQLAVDLSEALSAAISLELLPKKNGGKVLALEALSATTNVCSLLRDGKTHMLPGLLDRDPGMQSMDRSLLDLATRAVIEGREAYARASDKRLFAAWA